MTPKNTSPIHVALVGYGSAGRVFHAPLISGVQGLALCTVVSSKPQVVQAQWPDVRVLPTAAQAFADPTIDLVVVATGNDSHFATARDALLAGKHVVVDKPCTVTLQETDELLALSAAKGKTLTVFQNRRWDADYLSLRQVLGSAALGRVVHFESHFDRYRPVVPDRWRERDLAGSGLWFDLGPHLIDQALQLFGCPDAVLVDLAVQRDGAKVNDYFHAQLRYTSTHPGLRVMLHASALVPKVGPRFVVHGTVGSLVKYGVDVQEDALKLGARPVENKLGQWGQDPQPGTVTTYTESGAVVAQAPELAGNYLSFYSQLRDHLQGRQALPAVTARQVREVMAVLTVGAQSAVEGRFLPVPWAPGA